MTWFFASAGGSACGLNISTACQNRTICAGLSDMLTTCGRRYVQVTFGYGICLRSGGTMRRQRDTALIVVRIPVVILFDIRMVL
jgi:hypothetical protein